MDRELKNIARRDMNSVLRRKDFDAMSTFSLDKILREIQTMCPITFASLSQMLELDCGEEKKVAPLCLIYGVLMFRRCHELSYMQRLITILLADSEANTEVNSLKILKLYVLFLTMSV